MNIAEQDKELLIKDLCARLPYGVIIHFNEGIGEDDQVLYGIHKYGKHTQFNDGYFEDEFKPYLRPMKPSEATEQELKEIEVMDPDYHSVDWLNAHHFDYRGLIEMGLALEAPNGMYDL